MALAPIPAVGVVRALRSGEFVPVEEFAPLCAQLPGQVLVYEVIRVHRGRMLFAWEHAVRLANSLRQVGGAGPDLLGLPARAESHIPPPGGGEIPGGESGLWAQIVRLARLQTGTQNLRVEVLVEGSELLDYAAYFVPSTYPRAHDYEQGVRVGILAAERPQPGAKVQNAALRANADAMMARDALYEVLLVNSHGQITEGSRSNVIFMDGHEVITPPLAQILPGITRTKVLEAALALDFRVTERTILLDEIHLFPGAALTGTSPGVLPIAWVEGREFHSSYPQILALRAEYERIAQESLGEK